MSDTGSDSDCSFLCTTAREIEKVSVANKDYIVERLFVRWLQGLWWGFPSEEVEDTRTVEEREWAASFDGADAIESTVGSWSPFGTCHFVTSC